MWLEQDEMLIFKRGDKLSGFFGEKWFDKIETDLEGFKDADKGKVQYYLSLEASRRLGKELMVVNPTQSDYNIKDRELTCNVLCSFVMKNNKTIFLNGIWYIEEGPKKGDLYTYRPKGHNIYKVVKVTGTSIKLCNGRELDIEKFNSLYKPYRSNWVYDPQYRDLYYNGKNKFKIDNRRFEFKELKELPTSRMEVPTTKTVANYLTNALGRGYTRVVNVDTEEVPYEVASKDPKILYTDRFMNEFWDDLGDVLHEGNIVERSKEEEVEAVDTIQAVEKWATDRNFFGEGGATIQSQFVKLIEEAGELAGNIARGKDCTDDIGDMGVVLINIAKLAGTDFKTCLAHAYNEIKDRKGQWKNGVFVKETDLR